MGDSTVALGVMALYIFMLAAIAGHVIISRVPVILHTPLMSGSNFIHGIVLIGAMVVLGHAQTPLERGIGFLAVLLGAGNAAGGYVVTERMLATAATFLLPGLHNLALIVVALVLGTAGAWVWGKKVAITDIPQMVALFNGMGGGSAAAIGAVELLGFSAEGAAPSQAALVLGVIGALIGAVSLAGSVIAWAKLDGRMDKRYVFPGQQAFNALVALAAVVLGALVVHTLGVPLV